MTNYTITLSSQTYQRLLATAQAQGVTPEHWINSQLPTPVQKRNPEQQLLSVLLAGYIGVINSKTQPTQTPKQTPFGEAIAAKLAKQGIHRP